MKNDKIVVSQIKLAPSQKKIITVPTPSDFIKTKPGRGGKKMSYVEGGYVIAKLNEAFTPFGWEFKVTERGETTKKNEKSATGEVWVYGELTIKDHKNGFHVTKGQYGQHNIHENVPTGDAYKAAATDALKKCASMLGIALDVYWKQDDGEDASQKPTQPQAQPKKDLFAVALKGIQEQTSTDILLEWVAKIKDSKLYSPAEKEKLISAISQRYAEIAKE